MKFLAIYVTIFLGLASTVFPYVEWDGTKMVRSEQEWLAALGQERFQTMRRKASDRAFVGQYAYPPLDPGTYQCAGCGLCLFHSNDQYDGGGGFPCFKQAINSKHIHYEEDFSLPFKRYEVLCRKCDSHLGHLFHDGPPTKYFRYCVNSTALQYVKKKVLKSNM